MPPFRCVLSVRLVHLSQASNSDITLSDSLNIRAHGGNLVVRDTKVFSWDISKGDYDMDTDDGRA